MGLDEEAHVIQKAVGARVGEGRWGVLARGGPEVDHHGFVVGEGEV